MDYRAPVAALVLAVIIWGSSSTPLLAAPPKATSKCRVQFNPDTGETTLLPSREGEACRYASTMGNSGSYFLGPESVVSVSAATTLKISVLAGLLIYDPPREVAPTLKLGPLQLYPKGWVELRAETDVLVVLSKHAGLKVKSLGKTHILASQERRGYSLEGRLQWVEHPRSSKAEWLSAAGGIGCSAMENVSSVPGPGILLAWVLFLLALCRRNGWRVRAPRG